VFSSAQRCRAISRPRVFRGSEVEEHEETNEARAAGGRTDGHNPRMPHGPRGARSGVRIAGQGHDEPAHVFEPYALRRTGPPSRARVAVMFELSFAVRAAQQEPPSCRRSAVTRARGPPESPRSRRGQCIAGPIARDSRPVLVGGHCEKVRWRQRAGIGGRLADQCGGRWSHGSRYTSTIIGPSDGDVDHQSTPAGSL